MITWKRRPLESPLSILRNLMAFTPAYRRTQKSQPENVEMYTHPLLKKPRCQKRIVDSLTTQNGFYGYVSKAPNSSPGPLSLTLSNSADRNSGIEQ